MPHGARQLGEIIMPAFVEKPRKNGGLGTAIKETKETFSKYKFIQEKRSVFLEVIIYVLRRRKKVQMNMCLILNG
jgi:hypothetical protein